MLFPTGVAREVIPLGGEYRIDDDGFRSDSAATAEQRALTAIPPDTSLALLGEPGIGKSRALRELAAADAQVVHIGLETVTDVHELQQRLAGLNAVAEVDSALVDHMAAGPAIVTLVLDGIDECPLSTKTLTHHLENVLRQHRAVRVLLGCRTADWPESLGTRLRALLPRLDIVELLPLGRADIATLAGTRGVDGQAFLTAVTAAAAAPLAALPLTLDLLLTSYQQTGQLPGSAVALYEQGLLLLVEEPDRDREPDKKPAGTAPQRLAVAAKLAAYTMLCGRSAIARAVPAADDDLLAGALAGGSEALDGGDVTVSADLVDATLSTALFSSRGSGRLGVVHASIAAYLTARYLTTHTVPEHQLRALLTRTNTLGRTRVPSRLRETAAWLVALDPERNSWLVDVDPQSLAAHAGLVNVAAVRHALVAYLLSAQDPELRTTRRRWRLAHPGLADQLRPALRAPLTEDAGPHLGHPVSRRAQVAVDIARHAGEHGSVGDLADLLASSSTNATLRSITGYALLDLDAVAAARTLRTVLNEVIAHPEHDPDDQLRGLALQANWPGSLTAAELVAALSHPQSTLIGSYTRFLSTFLNDVSDQVLVDLLRAISATSDGATSDAPQQWIYEDQGPPGPSTPAVPLALLTGTRRGIRVMTFLLSRALDSSELPAIVSEVGWLLAAALRQHQDVAVPDRFAEPADPEDEAARQLRRDLVGATLPHLPAAKAGLLVIRVHGTRQRGLVSAADLDWLLSMSGTEWETHAARLIRFVFDRTDIAQQELIWAHRGEAIVDESVGGLFDAVSLDSDLAARMREEHEWSLEPDRTWDGAAAHEPALRAAWAECEQGDPDGFLALCDRLRVDPTTGDLTLNDDLLSWPSCPLLTLEEPVLQAAAERYLLSSDANGEAWLDQLGSFPFRALFGYVALAYLLRQSGGKARLDALPDPVWQRWTPTILWFPTSLGDTDVHATLTGMARQHTPDPYRQWTLRRLEVTAQAGWSLDSLDAFADGYDDTVGDRLDALLRAAVNTMTSAAAKLAALSEPPEDTQEPGASDSDLRSRLSIARGNAVLLGAFLATRHADTLAYLRGLTDGTTAASVEARVLATEILFVCGLLGADELLAAMQADDEFGRALAVALARHRRDDTGLPRLTEAQLTELWWWLDANWSSRTDTLTSGFVTDDDHVRDWRNGIAEELQAQATDEALAALSQLVASRPNDYRLLTALAEAEARDHDESWQGVQVAELTALLANARRTLVNDDDALYRAVLASLGRFATRMRDLGQTLWNESRPAPSASGGTAKVWNPKYEPDVSAALHDHLVQEFGDQLVVNREVLVKQTTSKGHGLAVDVLPTATETAGGQHLPNCPIEVKGCWNADLLTDLQTQLVDDYLPATGATRGVYVCAWFPTEQWDDLADSRRPRAAARDRDAVLRSLTDAARAAGSSAKVEVAVVVIDIPRPTRSSRTGNESTGSDTAM